MKKGIKQYNIKSANNRVKDLDLGRREVAVYLSNFDNIDSDNDMISKGAFAKSIKERGVGSGSNRQIAFLRHHDWQHQIGKFTRLEEDLVGLFAVGKLGTSTKGDDALRDYDEGIISEHSIGFQYIEEKINWIDDSTKKEGGYFLINEVKLFEGSAVTFGANEMTGVVGVSKGLSKVDLMECTTKEINSVIKALINGRGSDQRLHDLEMKLKYLNSRLIDLANMDPDLAKIKEHKHINNDHKFNWQKLDKLIN